jgi:hypothetical protein
MSESDTFSLWLTRVLDWPQTIAQGLGPMPLWALLSLIAHSDDADQPFQRIPISHSDRSRSVWCGVSAPLDAFLISVFSPGVKPG